ncbi:hypothetical protein GGX14DRAFT_559627 [Mycena pura]|uniref:Uncharacterized protein n=1 Tax=Mycena pura TaxID=153505 RepID=A0AAD6YJ22_9AGAR|nr:hypothetical protein GGX14DRAFT_559627 [Mycena pura]
MSARHATEPAFLHFHDYPPAGTSSMWFLSLLFGLGFVSSGDPDPSPSSKSASPTNTSSVSASNTGKKFHVGAVVGGVIGGSILFALF